MGREKGEGPPPACVSRGDTDVHGPASALEEYCRPIVLEDELEESPSVTENRVGCTSTVLTQKTSAVAFTTNPVEGHPDAFRHDPPP